LSACITQDWELEDPKGKSIEKVRQIRDEVKARVAKLIHQLRLNDAERSGEEK